MIYFKKDVFGDDDGGDDSLDCCHVSTYIVKPSQISISQHQLSFQIIVAQMQLSCVNMNNIQPPSIALPSTNAPEQPSWCTTRVILWFDVIHAHFHVRGD